MTDSTDTTKPEAAAAAALVDALVMCDDCNQSAEYVEHLYPQCALMPRYKCEKHKPRAAPREECFGIFMGNKY